MSQNFTEMHFSIKKKKGGPVTVYGSAGMTIVKFDDEVDIFCARRLNDKFCVIGFDSKYHNGGYFLFRIRENSALLYGTQIPFKSVSINKDGQIVARKAGGQTLIESVPPKQPITLVFTPQPVVAAPAKKSAKPGFELTQPADNPTKGKPQLSKRQQKAANLNSQIINMERELVDMSGESIGNNDATKDLADKLRQLNELKSQLADIMSSRKKSRA